MKEFKQEVLTESIIYDFVKTFNLIYEQENVFLCITDKTVNLTPYKTPFCISITDSNKYKHLLILLKDDDININNMSKAINLLLRKYYNDELINIDGKISDTIIYLEK